MSKPSSSPKPSKIKHSALVKIHNFLHEVEALKRLLRHSWLSDGRRESVAEHTWRMALMAIVLADEIEDKVDVGRVVMMVVVHDLAEVYAGDYHAFGNVPLNKHELEAESLKKLVADLSRPTQKLLTELWHEFEARQTPEAKFAQALDKLEVLIQHNEAGTGNWEDKEFDFNYYYAYDKVTHSDVLTLFRDLILEETHDLVSQEAERDNMAAR